MLEVDDGNCHNNENVINPTVHLNIVNMVKFYAVCILPKKKKKKKKIALPHQLALCSPGCPQIILFVLGFEFTFTRQALYHLSHFTSPFFFGLFQDRSSRTICPGWLQTAILLISVS
jgi:hypothetical protein